jgi:hypothetical protein
MKKWILLIAMLVFICLPFTSAHADNSPGPAGPAPNSGDGIPDGSGFVGPPSPGPGND